MTVWTYCPECRTELQETEQSNGEKRLACPKGHYIHYNNPAPTTMGLVEYDGRFLIVKRANEPRAGKWDLTGGFIEDEEDPTESMLRELKEETGLTGTVQGIVGAFRSIYGDADYSIVGIAFHVLADSDQVTLSPENTAYEWRKLEDIPPLAFADTTAAVDAMRKQRRVST